MDCEVNKMGLAEFPQKKHRPRLIVVKYGDSQPI